jgi:hypothetical protein
MVGLRCQACGTELLPGARFCRRCGAQFVEGSTQASEAATAMLTPLDGATTQRLKPRPTAPAVILKQKPRRRSLLIIGIVILILIGVFSAIAITWRRTHTINSKTQLIYPGASTVLDFAGEDGSRTFHMKTSDPLEKVESWYQSNLRMTKTTRLTTNSYVLKSDGTIITLVSEDNTTNIFIKQSP